MDRDQQPPNRNQMRLVLWMIWGSLITAIFIYLFIVDSQTDGRVESENISRILVFILGGVSLFLLAVSLLVRRKAVQAAANPDPAKLGMVLTFSIFAWAMSEAIAIFGLLLGLLGAEFKTCAPFFLVSMIALAIHAPAYLQKDSS